MAHPWWDQSGPRDMNEITEITMLTLMLTLDPYLFPRGDEIIAETLLPSNSAKFTSYSLPFSLNPSPSYHLPTLLYISSLSIQSSHRLTAIPSFPSIQYRVHSSSRPRICDGSKSPGRQHHVFKNFFNIYLKHCSKHI